ncbi:MAG: hypothetical protein QMB51_02335 [Patescibacteria group bacterium]
MINNSFNDIALQLIKSSATCPICASGAGSNKKTQAISAQMIDKSDDKSIFYLKCNNCRASMISIISTSDNGGNAVVFMTDLTPGEISKFRKQQPISINDVKEIQNI